MATRRKPPIDVVRRVLHEAGYKCANPACRMVLTLDVHHMEYVSEGGSNEPDNLLALCKNCHGLHHDLKVIPSSSIRAWKMLLLALNEAFDRKSVDFLLALSILGRHDVTGDGLLDCSSLISSGMIEYRVFPSFNRGQLPSIYEICLSERGKAFVEAWKQGNQQAALNHKEAK